MATKAISVYSTLRTGIHSVCWDADHWAPVTVGVTLRPDGDHCLSIPGVGLLTMHACKGTNFADYLRILLDDECPPMLASQREPGGRWQGITKVLS